MKRSPDSPSRPNDWDLPGGNVSFGELHEDSLRREIQEETQLQVQDIEPAQLITNFKDDIYYIFVGQLCHAAIADVSTSFEHTDFKWVTKQEFFDLKPAQFLIDLVNKAC